jgi:hypothetical protein
MKLLSDIKYPIRMWKDPKGSQYERKLFDANNMWLGTMDYLVAEQVVILMNEHRPGKTDHVHLSPSAIPKDVPLEPRIVTLPDGTPDNSRKRIEDIR